MNERMKILELLSSGKISAEQADMLLEALDDKSKRNAETPKFGERFSFPDLKNLGTQVSAAVSQSLGDVKRVMEQQLDSWSSSPASVTVTHSLSLPPDIANLSVETTNGKVQVFAWDEPHVKIEIRAQMRTNNLADGKRALEDALQVSHVEHNYELAVIHGRKDVETHTLVGGAHLDLYIPTHLMKVHVRTQNGGIFVDSIQVPDLQVTTTNGGVSLFRSSAERLHVETENGSIEVQGGIGTACRNVYAYTKNGRLSLQGLPVNLNCVGTARTTHGRIDIRQDHLVAEFDDMERKNFVRFRPLDAAAVGTEETRIHLETRNGSIKIR
jgi:DUF4097 and DUF4098 domain-containing protein YvlB